MDTEYLDLTRQDTWTVINRSELLKGRKILRGQWVYRTKRDQNGIIVRYKARWVLKGFSQKLGIDFDETFAPTTRPEIQRLLFAYAAYKNYEMG